MTAKEIADLFAELELHLIASLKRNITRHKRQEEKEGGTGGVPEKWEAWQSAKLRDIQRFRRENKQILGEYQSTIDSETEKLLRDQYAEGGSDGFFHTSDDKLNALIREMQNNEARVGRAALRYMDDVYRKTVLRTATAMTAGGMTLAQATDEATKDFLAQGVNCVEYANGRRVNIATYAEMALRTCSTRAMLMGEAKQRERMGIDTVLVSQYGACSDTCLPWQGKVYIDDVFQEYHGPGGGSFGVSRNGRQYMFLSIAIQGGLFHPNCRHTISTWIEGVSRMPRPMNIREIERVNKLEAEQRKLEREVRQAKREEAGATDPGAVKVARDRKKEAQAELQDFIKEHTDVLRRDYWRERYDNIPEKNQRDAELVKLARASDTFSVIPPAKGDAIKAQSIYKELQKSEVGKHAYDYIIQHNVPVEINYTDEFEPGTRGYTFGGSIFVYARNTKTVRLTTETIIHEAMHVELGAKKRTQWEEALCFAQEAKHKKKQLTYADLKNIVKTVKTLYPNYPWR